MSEFDSIAQELYRLPFDKISPHGQNRVRKVYAQRNPPVGPLGMDHVDLAAALALAHEKIAELESDYKELWLDNEELELENLELREQLNASSNRRST